MRFFPKWMIYVAITGVVAVVVSLGIWFFLFKAGRPISPEVVIEVPPPDQITLDTPVEFNASPSKLGIPISKVQDVRYFWDFGDGSSAAGKEVTHQYQAPGEYDVSLTIEVIDTSSKFYKTEGHTTVTIPMPPLPDPVAEFSYSPEEHVRSHDKVVFDASSSHFETTPSPSLNTQWEYEWDFGDGKGIIEGKQIKRQFNPPKEYLVTLTVKVTDQFGRTKIARKEKTVRVDNLPPQITVIAEPNGPDGTFIAGEPIIFDATGSRDPDEGTLQLEWDFDGDGIVDHRGPELRVKWDEGFDEEGSYTVIVRAQDDFMKKYQPDLFVTFPLTINVSSSPSLTRSSRPSRPIDLMPDVPELGPFVASGGLSVLGDLQLWNVAAGMDIHPTFSALLGYGSNTNTVTIDHTGEHPEVKRAFPDAHVTTTIKEASMFNAIVYYRAYQDIYVGGGLGYLTLKGEHRSDHPRVLIDGKRVIPFEKSSMILTFGIAYKLGFALISFQVNYAL